MKKQIFVFALFFLMFGFLVSGQEVLAQKFKSQVPAIRSGWHTDPVTGERHEQGYGPGEKCYSKYHRFKGFEEPINDLIDKLMNQGKTDAEIYEAVETLLQQLKEQRNTTGGESRSRRVNYNSNQSSNDPSPTTPIRENAPAQDMAMIPEGKLVFYPAQVAHIPFHVVSVSDYSGRGSYSPQGGNYSSAGSRFPGANDQTLNISQLYMTQELMIDAFQRSFMAVGEIRSTDPSVRNESSSGQFGGFGQRSGGARDYPLPDIKHKSIWLVYISGKVLETKEEYKSDISFKQFLLAIALGSHISNFERFAAQVAQRYEITIKFQNSVTKEVVTFSQQTASLTTVYKVRENRFYTFVNGSTQQVSLRDAVAETMSGVRRKFMDHVDSLQEARPVNERILEDSVEASQYLDQEKERIKGLIRLEEELRKKREANQLLTNCLTQVKEGKALSQDCKAALDFKKP